MADRVGSSARRALTRIKGLPVRDTRGMVKNAHAVSAEQVLAELGSRAQGLRAGEAAERLAQHGPNALPAAKPRGALSRFLAQFDSPLIGFLLAAALAAAFLGHGIDTAVII